MAGRASVAEGHARVRRHTLAQERFEEQPSVSVKGRIVMRRFGGFWVNQLDWLIKVLDAVNKRGFTIAYER